MDQNSIMQILLGVKNTEKQNDINDEGTKQSLICYQFWQLRSSKLWGVGCVLKYRLCKSLIGDSENKP